MQESYIYSQAKKPKELQGKIDSLESEKGNELEKNDPSNRVDDISDRYIKKVERMAKLFEAGSSRQGFEYAQREIEFMDAVAARALAKLEGEKGKLKERKLHKLLDQVERDLLGVSFNRALEEKKVMMEVINDTSLNLYMDILDDPLAFGLDKNPFKVEIYDEAMMRALAEGRYYLIKPNAIFNQDYPGFKSRLDGAIYRGILDAEFVDLHAYFLEIGFKRLNSDMRASFLRRFAEQDPEMILSDFRAEAFVEWPEFKEYMELACRNRESSFALNMDWSKAIDLLGEDKVRELQIHHFEQMLVSSPQAYFRHFGSKRMEKLADYWKYSALAAQKVPAEVIKVESRIWHHSNGRKMLREVAGMLLQDAYPTLFSLMIQKMRPGSARLERIRNLYGEHFPEVFIRRGVQYFPDLLEAEFDVVKKFVEPYEAEPLLDQLQGRTERFKKRRSEVVDYMMRTYPQSNDDYEQQKNDFATDPAFAFVSLIEEHWIGEKEPNRRVQTTVNVARALYAKGEVPNYSNVQRELKRLHAVHENPEYMHMNLFKGRDVIMAAHMEKDEKGYKFGRNYTKAAVGKIQGGDGSVERFRPDKKRLDVIGEAKKDLLQSMLLAERPLTTIMDGHGGEFAWYFSDGRITGGRETPEETEQTIKVSYKELAEVFKQRYERGKDVSKDVLIIDACKSYNLAINIYKELKSMGMKKGPVIVSSTEYKLYGFSDSSARTGASFQEWIIQKTDGTLGAFFNMDDVEDHNPSVFIFDEEEDDFLQVADATSPGSSDSRLG